MMLPIGIQTDANGEINNGSDESIRILQYFQTQNISYT